MKKLSNYKVASKSGADMPVREAQQFKYGRFNLVVHLCVQPANLHRSCRVYRVSEYATGVGIPNTEKDTPEQAIQAAKKAIDDVGSDKVGSTIERYKEKYGVING